MADFLPFDLNAIVELASANAMGFWTALIVNLVLSTVVSGIVLIIVLMLFNRVYGEMLVLKRAFLVVLLVNIINYVGIVGFLSPAISGIPFIGIILPILIWVIMLKVFFEDMSFLHTLIVGIVFYGLTIVAIPYLINMVSAFVGI
jgi:hypothetical protein